jgi:hypothetical protein
MRRSPGRRTGWALVCGCGPPGLPAVVPRAAAPPGSLPLSSLLGPAPRRAAAATRTGGKPQLPPGAGILPQPPVPVFQAGVGFTRDRARSGRAGRACPASRRGIAGQIPTPKPAHHPRY